MDNTQKMDTVIEMRGRWGDGVEATDTTCKAEERDKETTLKRKRARDIETERARDRQRQGEKRL